MPQPSGSMLFVILAVLSGIATAFQPGVNSRFADVAGSRMHGAVANFAAGLVVTLVVAAMMGVQPPALSKLAQGPWWMWTGGALGAFFVTMAIVIVPKIGTADYLAAMVAGQLLASALIDSFGLMGLKQQPISATRILGLVLVGAGVLVLRIRPST